MLAWLGFIPLIIKGKGRVAITVFMLATLYIVSAWDIWWYSGIGGRAMIQSYPILFIPFGYLLTEAFRRKWMLLLLTPVMLAFAYVSLWTTIQAHNGTSLFDAETMSKAYYWHVVGRWHITDKDEAEKLKDTDHIFTGKLKDQKLEYSDNYENDTSIHEMPMLAIEGNKSAYIKEGLEFSATARFPLHTDKKWLRAQVMVKCTNKEWNVWNMTQFTVKLFNSKGDNIKTSMIRLHRFLNDNELKSLHIDLQMPDGVERAEVYLWNPGSNKLLMIDNLQVWSFNE